MSDYRPGWRLNGFDPRGSATGKLPVRREEKMKVIRAVLYAASLAAAYWIARCIERHDGSGLIRANHLSLMAFATVAFTLCVLVSMTTGGME